MSAVQERRLKALHAAEYDESHFVRVRNALEAVGFPSSDDVVLVVGHALLSHPAAAAKLRILSDVWETLGRARTVEANERVMFEIR